MSTRTAAAKQTVTHYIHGYQIPIDPTRTAQWLDLPSSGQFRLLAMSCAPLVGALSQGQYLTDGKYIASPSGNCYLTQQSDGNLVLYNGSGPGNKGAAIWASGGHGGGGIFYTVMQSDGNLVTYTGTPDSPAAPDLGQRHLRRGQLLPASDGYQAGADSERLRPDLAGADPDHCFPQPMRQSPQARPHSP